VNKVQKQIKALDSYFIGNIGESEINIIYQRNKIACTSLGTSDFGEDILCDIFSHSEEYKTNIRTKFSFRTQVKTTEEIKKEGYIRQTSKGFSISLESKLLNLWSDSYYPVVLAIWDCSNNKGYWCFPVEQINTIDLKKDKPTIVLKFDNIFDNEGVSRIKEKVESYYNNIFKIDKSKYKCTIYPIWMPKYRLFTSAEVYNIFSTDKLAIKKVDNISEMIPSFLASYNNCNFNGAVSGVEFSDEPQPIEKFMGRIYDFINKVELKVNNYEWAGFIISPIEIISETDDRVISNLTDWTCISMIGDKIVSDFQYNYGLGTDYIYSRKVRALSDEQDLFVHKSGDFAVEVFSVGYPFVTRNSQSQLMHELRNKSFCILDISKCSLEEVNVIMGWCNKNNYRFIELEEDDNRVIISHMYFEQGNFGTMLPGVLTWGEWDKLNFESEEFTNTIPYGKTVDQIGKQRIFKKYFNNNEQFSGLYLLKYSQALDSEALCHKDRIIKFLSYIEPINMENYKEIIKLTKQEIGDIFEQFTLVHIHYERVTDIILEVRPALEQSTQEAIIKVEKIYHNLIKVLKSENIKQNNMGYYIKYRLDRWIPEKIVNINSD